MTNSPSTPRHTAAANIRQLRTSIGWSLAELSQRVTDLGHSMSLTTLSRMELGERGIDVNDLVPLADALQTTPMSLLSTDPRTASQDRIHLLWRHYEDALQSERRAAEVAAEHTADARARLERAARSDENARNALVELLSPDDGQKRAHRRLVGEALRDRPGMAEHTAWIERVLNELAAG